MESGNSGAVLSKQKSPAPPKSQSPNRADLGVAESMNFPLPGSSTTTPFDKLVQGLEQKIEIPLKTILTKGMQTMPAKKPPVFKCIHAGPSGYQVSVELDVSGSRFTVEPSTTIAKVIGDVCVSTKDAVDSAVLKAFEYLEQKHFVHVVDYSSKVVEDYDDKPTWGNVNSCFYVTEKVLADWSNAIDSIGKFCSQLDMKEGANNMYGTRSPAGERYSETRKFISCLWTRYINKHRALNSAFMGQEGRRSAYLKESNDKTNAIIMKGYRQAIHFTEKDVLDYVLRFVGLKEPEYSNKPLESGLFRGEVELWLPEIEQAKCAGRTKFKGINMLTASSAEEDAAAKALKFIETKLKITVLDKNYVERVAAKEKHIVLMKLLRDVLHISEQIKIEWSRMVAYLDDGVGIYGESIVNLSARSMDDDELAAVKFCSDEISAAHTDCVRAYEAAVMKINGLEKYYPDKSFDEE